MTEKDRLDGMRKMLDGIDADAGRMLEMIGDMPEVLHYEILLEQIQDDARTLKMMIDHTLERYAE